ncbi:hypothetical protein D3C81_1345390 [compost metagenome]
MNSARSRSSTGISRLSELSWLAVSYEPVLTERIGRPACRAPRHKPRMRASGLLSLVSSRPARGTPLIAARLTARMMSSRSPGVTTRVPGVSSGTVLATVRAQMMILFMRRCS